MKRIIKKHWRKIALICTTIFILLTTTISASANGFTTTGNTLIRYTSADFKSVSMNLPYIGGDRAYFYSNSGVNVNSNGGNQIMNKVVPTHYNLMYLNEFDVYTQNKVNASVNGRSTNEISHYIVPVSIDSQYNDLLYGFEIYIPFAVGGKKTENTTYEQDYIINISGGVNEDIEPNIYHIFPNATDLNVEVSYHYAYVENRTQNGKVYSYYATTGTTTRRFTVPMGQNFAIYSSNTKPERDNYIILDTLITITFTAKETMNSTGDTVRGAEQRFTLTTKQPLSGSLDTIFQSSQISRDLNVQTISINDFSFTEWAVTQVNSFLGIQIIWGVTIGSILWFIVGVSLFFFLMKVFLGG